MRTQQLKTFSEPLCFLSFANSAMDDGNVLKIFMHT